MEEKVKIRRLGLRHLQKQKCQAAMMTLKPQFWGSFSSTRQGTAQAVSETPESLKVNGPVAS
jgi:hypothetical protein